MRVDSAAGSPYPIIFHEYTHLFLRGTDQRFPLWLNEGLAEFYQHTDIYKERVLLGQADQQQLMFLRQSKLLPLALLFAADEKSPYYLEQKKGSVFHSECWALTHYLMLRDYGEKTSKVQQYVSLVNENVDSVSAAISIFGDLGKLQQEIEEYIQQRSFDHFETRLPVKTDADTFEVQRITPGQAQGIQADYLAANGRLEDARALNPSSDQNGVAATGATVATPSLQQTQREDKELTKLQSDNSCPLAEILKAASERATEMVDNLQRFTATEEIEYTELKRHAKRLRSTQQWFSYVANVEQGPSGAFWIEEYRSAKTSGDASPMSDTGTATFALIFHPEVIGNFEFHCEGQTEVHGSSAWQLTFTEAADPRKSFHQIRIGNSVYQLRFKGRAWIAADDHQILRLQTDLVAPLPQIHLQLEHLDISYAPVEFDKTKFRVWLPESASVELKYRDRSYHRVHRFSHFQLFLVDTQQTVKEPTPGPGA